MCPEPSWTLAGRHQKLHGVWGELLGLWDHSSAHQAELHCLPLMSAPQKLETSVKGLQGKMGQSVVEISEKLKQMQSRLLNPLFPPPPHLKNKPCICSVLSNLPSVFITLSHFILTSTHTHSCLSDFLYTQMNFTEKLAWNSLSPTHFFFFFLTPSLWLIVWEIPRFPGWEICLFCQPYYPTGWSQSSPDLCYWNQHLCIQFID